jgi:hypothetical protein
LVTLEFKDQGRYEGRIGHQNQFAYLDEDYIEGMKMEICRGRRKVRRSVEEEGWVAAE